METTMDRSEYWPKDTFDSQKTTTLDWIMKTDWVGCSEKESNPEAYKDKVIKALETSDFRREEIRNWYDKVLDEHIRLACDICGMTVVCSKFGYEERISRGKQIAQSVKDDPSEENIKRFFWILWYSFTATYKAITGFDMAEYNEVVVMKEKSIKYSEDSKEEENGCISKLMNRAINNYRNNVRESIASSNLGCIASLKYNSPTASEYTGILETAKHSRSTFWVGIKRKVIEAVHSPTGKKTTIFDWTAVSNCVLR